MHINNLIHVHHIFMYYITQTMGYIVRDMFDVVLYCSVLLAQYSLDIRKKKKTLIYYHLSLQIRIKFQLFTRMLVEYNK